MRQKYTNVGSATNEDFIPIIKKHIPQEARSVLDVGCGMVQEGDSRKNDILFSCFSNKKYHVTGIDKFKPNIDWRKANQKGNFIEMDARDLKTLCKNFDIVICNHVIEHFVKEESLSLISILESMTNKLLVIGTPIGYVDTKYNVILHHNELEEHKCGYMPEEFEEKGYYVYQKKKSLIAIKKF